MEYAFLQVAARLAPGDICVEFPNHTHLLVPPRMKGAAHFIAPRLCEFEEMSFVMHFLRPGMMFMDIGANIGAFTVLAAGVAGARAKAFEPSPLTYEILARNLSLNDLQGRAQAIPAAVGRNIGEIQFSVDLGTENHVVANNSKQNSQRVRMTTLDHETAEDPPELLKVDVEGFEPEVFAGGTDTLRRPQLRGIIMERNNSGTRYGFDEEGLHAQIREQGFVPCRYEPLARKLTQITEQIGGNVIYIRDWAAANARLQAAPAFKLGDLTV
ncbi:MAG TPA: FkbM family methyltransferase [Candidatus Sulfopaludibacter sp.]|nr:FkbM family methyltransferase [Candidatus Sulfopaludibacter sp.]